MVRPASMPDDDSGTEYPVIEILHNLWHCL